MEMPTRNSKFLIFVLFAFQTQASVPVRLKLVKQPPSMEIFFQVSDQGDPEKPFTLECEAEGEPRPVYSWTKDGKEFHFQNFERISIQSNKGSLVFTSPRPEDAGIYQCFAENELGRAASNRVSVRQAYLKPFESSAPKLVSAKPGQSLKLECLPPDGYPMPELQWSIQGSNGNLRPIEGSRIAVDAEGSLWFSEIQADDGFDNAYYVCVASSRALNQTRLGPSIQLKVSRMKGGRAKSPMPLWVSSSEETAFRGQRKELFCIYSGSARVEWKKNRQVIANSQNENFGKSLVIKKMDFQDEAEYSCEVSDGPELIQIHTISLKMILKPYFVFESEPIFADDNETVQFRCEAQGNPKPEISWTFNARPIDDKGGRITIGPQSLNISQVQRTDAGIYGCNASSPLGYVYHEASLLVLQMPPMIKDSKNEFEIRRGETITLPCNALGSPTPKMHWLRTGSELEGDRFAVWPNGDLTIHATIAADTGLYTCRATNKYGFIEVNRNLKITG